jgi:hypothetical protein
LILEISKTNNNMTKIEKEGEIFYDWTLDAIVAMSHMSIWYVPWKSMLSW